MTKFRNSRSEALLQPYHFNKDTMTQEQFAYDCDINNIVAGMTAAMPIRNRELSDEVKVMTPDLYEKALYTKAAAENAFNELPSKVREEFGNNPAKMLEFVSNPSNAERCIELGLMVRKESNPIVESIDKLASSINSSGVITSEKTVDTVIPKESQGA